MKGRLIILREIKQLLSSTAGSNAFPHRSLHLNIKPCSISILENCSKIPSVSVGKCEPYPMLRQFICYNLQEEKKGKVQFVSTYFNIVTLLWPKILQQLFYNLYRMLCALYANCLLVNSKLRKIEDKF